MARIEIELNPVDHITVDAIGPPGKRVFYIQGWHGNQVTTLIMEKFQIQTLAIGAEQFLAEITKKFSDLREVSPDYVEEKMHIHPPVDPLYRVGEIGLGYDPETDLVILEARELVTEEQREEAGVVRFFCTRTQLRALCHWGLEVASRGRELCPQCGEPIDPVEGHFCPKKNGHLH